MGRLSMSVMQHLRGEPMNNTFTTLIVVCLLLNLVPLNAVRDEGVLHDQELSDQPEWHAVSSTSSLELFRSGSQIQSVTIPIFGNQNTCAITNDGVVKCWGSNQYGQLGQGQASVSVQIPTSIYPHPTSSGLSVSTSEKFSCAVFQNGNGYCWGYGDSRLGIGASSSQMSPAQLPLPTGVNLLKISTGDAHGCALTSNGNVLCWGSNEQGQLGIGQTMSYHSTPTYTTSFGRNVTGIDLGSYHGCGIMDNGLVKCWGWNNQGQLGDGTTSTRTSPSQTSSFGNNRTAIQVSGGYQHTCAVLDNGSIACWGWNQYGQLGDGTTSLRTTPKLVSGFGANRTAISVSAGQYATCAVTSLGELYCWGNSGNGVFWDGTTTRLEPELMPSFGYNSKVLDIMMGQSHACATIRHGFLSCWGSNGNSQLGDGGISNRLISTNFSDLALTPDTVDEIVEGVSVELVVHGSAFDTFNASTTALQLQLPSGLQFNQSNMTIFGTPQLTIQSSWNYSISDANHSVNGTFNLFVLADSDGDTIPNTVDLDDDGDGIPDTTDACPTQAGNSSIDVVACPDTDGDGYSNQGDAFPNDGSQYTDADSDGYGDNASGSLPDACPSTYGSSTRGGEFGCPDGDGDGWADQSDTFPDDLSQWNDTDGDGYGDSIIGFEGDACPQTAGNSTVDRFGCLDADGDGTSDLNDAFTTNPTQQSDRDGDGYGDNQTVGATQVDMFPSDGTQWNDTDGDGHGDNPFGSQGDWFPNDPSRWQDSDRDGIADEDDAFDNDASQWNDTDGDGHGDNPGGTAADRFPNDPSRWQDTDHDGVADEDDAFPDDATQQTDADGDGYGDNINGNRGDVFPNDPEEWSDTDGDGVGNNADAFPFNPSQTQDTDGDGFGDNPLGTGADAFFEDPTQWSDVDGDGHGDNVEGTDADRFPRDITQWYDRDGDGCGDNPTGSLPDAFPDDATQCEDGDGDGLGDRPDGNNPDPYPGDRDNDGYADIEDPFPDFASPGDMDNDGVLDADDAFPGNYRESADNDGDGDGDNADIDDDNDGWTDADEIRAGTDPFHPLDYPVDTFEIVIPGTQVGLGAWDLIGMFGGIPLFFWIMFGFVTRNGRTARFEEQLRASQSRDELEKVALRWEYMLMLRMLGPHQGIRLERLRAELDDRFEAQGQHLAHLDQHEVDQTNLVVEQMQADEEAAAAATSSAAEKPVVEIPSGAPAAEAPPVDTPPTQVADGYEWLEQDGQKWYRAEGSGAEWSEWTQ